MNKNKLLYPLACVVLLSGSGVYAEDECITIRGAIHTNIISNEPSQPALGTIGIRTADERKICGIQGQVTGIDSETSLPLLEHQIVCKDHSVFATTDAVTSYIPKDDCVVSVVEESTIFALTGEFAGATGTTTSKGTINLCNGENDLRYRGKLCFPEVPVPY